MPRTPKQQRQATARMLAKKLPANPKVKPGATTLSPAQLRRAIRDLSK